MNRLLSALLIPLAAGWLTVCDDGTAPPGDSLLPANVNSKSLDDLLNSDARAAIDKLAVSDPAADGLVRFIRQQLAAGQTEVLHTALEALHFGLFDQTNRWLDKPENAEDLGYLVASIMVGLADPELQRSRKTEWLHRLLGMAANRTLNGTDSSDAASGSYFQKVFADLEAGRSEPYIAVYELAVHDMPDEAQIRFDEVMIRVTGLQANAR